MLAELYSHLSKAPDAEQSTPIAKTIETLWLRSGSETIGLLMRRALKAVEEQRMDLALKLLDSVVDLAPDYAEGFSRRAYVHYLKNDYTSAVGDLRRTLALEPNHYKALEGLGRILRENGQKKSALKIYQELLAHLPAHARRQGGRRRADRRGRGPGHLARFSAARQWPSAMGSPLASTKAMRIMLVAPGDPSGTPR